MREFVTTLLDTTGLLLVAAGVTGGAWLYVGPWALVCGGAVVLTGSWLATADIRAATRKLRRSSK
jgi:hypothetical protein